MYACLICDFRPRAAELARTRSTQTPITRRHIAFSKRMRVSRDTASHSPWGTERNCAYSLLSILRDLLGGADCLLRQTTQWPSPDSLRRIVNSAGSALKKA